MELLNIYSKGVVALSVCVPEDLSRNEIERLANEKIPTGITSQWAISEKTFASGQSNPCNCKDVEGRLHYLLHC